MCKIVKGNCSSVVKRLLDTLLSGKRREQGQYQSMFLYHGYIKQHPQNTKSTKSLEKELS